ncbi:hypothetical protein KVR01_011825 [Diaporthe batatas]|uniref:uncharacterized protein n=1 Tax=Diaporthe batatas TaxID=748121 RepID=UPI001D0406DD|nr:uncharacterized protein KVR01_011825 [Diaporthe batatas]KAG8158064.1 hypothetical protein KVR01_011825 [Diaporthe batatas]
MCSPMDHKPRVSRRQKIPGNLVNNWKSSAPRGAKPLVRRPRTACDRCRTAKVRCYGNGQHDCDRCASRGLPCRYIEPPRPLSPASLGIPSALVDAGNPEDSHSQMDFGADHLSDGQSASDSAALQQLLGSSVDPSSIDHEQTDSPEHQQQHQQQQQQMDWSAVDPALDWTIGMSPVAGLDLPGGFSSDSTTPPDSMGGSATNMGITTPTSGQQASLSSLGLLPVITSTNAADLSWQSQLLSPQGCQCRSGLALLIPNARAALQKRRLDSVLQVTSDIVQQCQGMVTCKNCRVNCTDLICIMAVFQEADVCFDYIAKGDIDSSISVSVGFYDMAADGRDAMQWRQMLVMQLWRRANKLLDSISASGQAMLRDLDPDCRLRRLNINYLQAVIENSRDNFSRVMKEFQEPKNGEDEREETD